MVDLKFKVELYLGDELITEDKLCKLVIHNPVVDRIINTAVERAYEITED